MSHAEHAQPPVDAPRPTGALLVDRTFGPWFWANLASNCGSWLYNVTAAVVVFNLTRSALFVGLVSVAQFGPLATLSPWAGSLSDRLDRRRLLLAGQAFAAASAAGIWVLALLLGVDELPGAWPVLVATLGIGIGLAFATPAQQSLVPALVEDADLESAVALTSFTYNVGRALGPAAAGVLLVTLGPEVAFALNAASFLGLIGVLFVVRARPLDHAVTGDLSVREGLRHVRDDRMILLLLGGVATVGFAADPAITLAPSLAEVIGGGNSFVATMVSGFGVAAALTTLLSAGLQRKAGSLRIARAGLLFMAAGLFLAALAPVPWLALTGFVVTGVGFAFGITSFTAMLQRRAPERLRGRIMALWTVAFLGNRPVAAVLDGAAADIVGPRLAMGIAVVVALVGVWLAARLEQDDATAAHSRDCFG